MVGDVGDVYGGGGALVQKKKSQTRTLSDLSQTWHEAQPLCLAASSSSIFVFVVVLVLVAVCDYALERLAAEAAAEWQCARDPSEALPGEFVQTVVCTRGAPLKFQQRLPSSLRF